MDVIICSKCESAICLKCGSEMILRSGPYSKFYGCSNYPECKNILKLEVVNDLLEKSKEKKELKRKAIEEREIDHEREKEEFYKDPEIKPSSSLETYDQDGVPYDEDNQRSSVEEISDTYEEEDDSGIY